MGDLCTTNINNLGFDELLNLYFDDNLSQLELEEWYQEKRKHFTFTISSEQELTEYFDKHVFPAVSDRSNTDIRLAFNDMVEGMGRDGSLGAAQVNNYTYQGDAFK